jgi:ATP-binding cassette subfamily B protein
MKLLWQYVKKQKKILILALVLATINQVFSLLDPQIFRLIIDNYASKALTLTHSEFFRGVITLLLASMGVAFVSRVAKNFQDFYVSIITQRVGANLYSKSISHSFSLPYAAFEDQRSGELLLKLQKARTDAQNLITNFVAIVFLTSVSMLFVLGYAFYVSWMIGLVYLFMVPIMGVVQFILSRRIKQAQRQIVIETAALAGSTTETLRNVELVKSLGLEDQETERLNTVNERILSLELQKIKLIRKLSFVQGTLVNAIRSTLTFLLMWFIFQRIITFGEFFTLYIYQFFIFEPLNTFGYLSNMYQETVASMEKLEDILNTPSEEKPKNPVKIPELKSIDFKNVTFSYKENTEHSLSSLNLEISKGESVAFVGPSGAGKTTIIKLLLGLYKPTSGQILINGIDAQTVDYDDLRQRIGYVSQDTQLFAGTIRENLLFVNPDATDEECLTVLKNAAALSIIEKNGLETKIGEGGIKISGGEKQRLAIARALLRKPHLIIFDEATSSLDTLTEREITKTIKEVAKIRPDLMVIMIAHRLSTISHADKIFVLERGKLSEEGNNENLLERGGLYSALWREQGASA